MPLIDVDLQPGVNVQKTQTLNQGGWSASQFMRFKDGLPQKVGGWVLMDIADIRGSTRELHAFADLDGNTYLAGGSEKELWLQSAYGTQDITPYRAETNPAPQFTTVAGSALVEVQDPGAVGIGLLPGDNVTVATPVAVGGLVISGLVEVTQVLSGGATWRFNWSDTAIASVINSGAVPVFDTAVGSPIVTVTLPGHGLVNGSTWLASVATTVGGITIYGTYAVLGATSTTFTITATNAAASTATGAMNGGNVRFRYNIGNGLNSALPLGAYGSGPYGAGPYGIGANIFYLQNVSLWSLDNWGEQLIANRFGGPIFVWAPPASLGQPAVQIPNAPTKANQIFVSMPARILVALGAETVGVQDPLLVRWSDVEDYTDWTATAINQAGSYRLATGNYIVAGVQSSTNAYLWTDVGLWMMKYISTPYVFGFTEIARGCGLIGPHALAQLSDDMFWMSQKQFFTFNGSGVTEIPCPVWDQVFQNLTELQASKVTAGANSFFGEVWWFYPSADSNENDSYVKYNMTSGTWDYGPIDRTAWIDQSVLGAPIGSSSVSEIFQHEVGNDDAGLPIPAWIESGYFMIADGDQFTYVDQLIPDVKFGIPTSAQNGTVLMTVKMVDFPTDVPRTYGPFPVNNITNFVSMRARGRQMALRFESNDLNSFWRLGRIRYRGAPAGRR